VSSARALEIPKNCFIAEIKIKHILEAEMLWKNHRVLRNKP